MKKLFLNLIFSMAIGGLLLAFTLHFFEIDKILVLIKSASPGGLVVSFLLIVLAYLLRGYRWKIWQKDLTYWDSLKLILVGFMGNNLLPARLGEILRAHCTAHKTGEGYGRTAALASIAIERVLDGLIISMMGILGLFLVPVRKIIFVSLLSVSLLFGFLTGGLIVGIYFHQFIRNKLTRINRNFPGHLTNFGIEKVNYFLDGLLLLEKFTTLFKAIIMSAVIWGTELVAYYLIANAVFAPVSLKICLLFLVVVNFASLFPYTIGGIGSIEGAATVFLVGAGIPAGPSLAMVLIQHFYQFAFTTISGAAFYFTDKYYKIPLIEGSTASKRVRSSVQQSGHDVVKNAQDRLEALSVQLGIEENNKREIRLSIVIPSYNEQNRLPKTVLETIAWCQKNVMDYELILVDDGSSDETPNIARLFADQVKGVRFIACPHLGKGATVRVGMLNAVGKYVLFMDADGATPLSEISKMLAKIDEGVDVVIGSRVVQKPGETEVVTKLHRKIIGRVFAAMVNIFAVPGFADTQCGFKMFRYENTRDIFSKQKINGFAFDVEVLFIANKLSLSISEIPVNWVNQEGSKVNIVTDSTRMLFDILRVRWLHKDEKWPVKERIVEASN